jgi:polysaccharide pyruvyl transferase WcaK-like protein
MMNDSKSPRILVDGLGPRPHVSIGSQALVIGAMQILRKRFPNAKLYLFSAIPEVEDEYLRPTGMDYEIVEKPDGILRRIRALRNIVNQVDAIVSPWGDAFITLPPYVSLRKTVFLKKRGVPLMLFTSSMGPFDGIFKTLLAKTAMRLFDIITVRDMVTYDYFQKLGFNNTRLLPDSAYVFEPSPPERIQTILRAEGIPESSSEYICVNVSVLLLNRMRERGLDYIDIMRQLIEHVGRLSGRHIVLLPHQVYSESYVKMKSIGTERMKSEGGDDRYAAELIHRAIPDTTRIHRLQGIYSANDYKGIIQGTEMFVGGRMHTVIGATSVNVPSAIMQYSHKALGLMRFLDLEQFVWRIDEPVDKLLHVVDELWSQREDCRRDLTERMPKIKEDAYSAADLLAERLNAS